MEDVLDAVEAASELSARMYKVGNINELALLKQNSALYKKRIEYKALQGKYLEAKERLIQRMNFDSRDVRVDVDARLPEPPKEQRKLSARELKAIGLGDINNPESVKTRSTARLSYESYLEKYQGVKSYKEEILPTQKKISEENLLRYNGMLIDVFHLLEDVETQSKTVMDYIDVNTAFLIQSARLDKDLMDVQMDFSNINVR
jgi:outer membrane protein TolC